MKKALHLLSLLCGTALFAVSTATAQGTSKLYMNDGRLLEGYVRTPLHSTISEIEFSTEPVGKTQTLPIAELKRIVTTNLDGSQVEYVKRYRYRMFKTQKKPQKGYYHTPILFRLDYAGPTGDELLTEFRNVESTAAMRTATKREQWLYFKLSDEEAARPLGVTNASEPEELNFRVFARRAFERYPEIISRINNGEFSINNPMKLVEAYEKISR